ncbi:hypothetical protein KTR10_00830 [Candidatus Kaiserbacteria bacterium]|nr:hypothetical protein [Candidatus Kaiserbacteria bacterium]
MFKSRNIFTQSIVSTLLIFVLVLAPLTPTLQTKKAEALFGVGDTSIVIVDIPRVVTEIANGIVYALAKAIVNRIVESTIRWINSGFRGSPTFIQDLDGFLLETLDVTVGDFIYGSELGFFCEPFQLSVRTALAIDYYGTGTERYACSLSGVANNIDNFIGDAGEEGWARWFNVTTQRQNNQYGALAQANEDLGVVLTNARGRELQLLDWGDGFITIEKCETGADGVEQCYNTTPGKLISEQLIKAVGAGQDTLIAADQINEIVGALLSQLAIQVISGAAGLLGLSGGGYTGYTGSRSYLDQLADEGAELTAAGERGEMELTKTQETQIRDTYVDVQNLVTDTQKEAKRLVDEEGCIASTAIPQELSDAYAEATEQIPVVAANVDVIDALIANYDGGDTEEAYDSYQRLVDADVFSTSADAVNASSLLNSAITASTSFLEDIESKCEIST